MMHGGKSHRLQPDEKSVLEALIVTYSDALVRFAYSYVKNASVAEEVMEDSFAALFVSGKLAREESYLRSYLYKIARNKCMDYLRHHRKTVPLEDLENVLCVPGPDAKLWKRERDKTVYMCMQALPEQYREVLQLKYFDNFAVNQICRISGKSTKQVYNLLARAKEALKKLLKKEGLTGEDIG